MAILMQLVRNTHDKLSKVVLGELEIIRSILILLSAYMCMMGIYTNGYMFRRRVRRLIAKVNYGYKPEQARI
jgi:hypothetical protein